MIAAVSWVPRGVAKPAPEVIEPPSVEELDNFRRLYEHAPDISADEREEDMVDDDDDNDNEGDVTASKSHSEEVENALNAAHALGCDARKASANNGLDDVAAGLAELDMDNYDNEDEGVELFGNGGLGAAYYSSNDLDPYLVDKDVILCVHYHSIFFTGNVSPLFSPLFFLSSSSKRKNRSSTADIHTQLMSMYHHTHKHMSHTCMHVLCTCIYCHVATLHAWILEISNYVYGVCLPLLVTKITILLDSREKSDKISIAPVSFTFDMPEPQTWKAPSFTLSLCHLHHPSSFISNFSKFYNFSMHMCMHMQTILPTIFY